MLYLMIVWPLASGWYGSKHGLSLIEVIVLSNLPVMIVLALR